MRNFLLIIIVFVARGVFAQLLNFSPSVKLNDNINSNFEEMNPLLSSDGSKLYFVRAFDPSNRGGELAGTDIWVSERDSLGEWGIATNKLDSWNNRSNNAVVGIGSNNDIVYLLNSYKSGKSGIAFSKKDNEGWLSPEVIRVPGINKNDFVGYYMNPDFDILLISMNRSDSYGQEDLYVSVKDSLQNWSAPINLGPTINTTGFEISPFLSKDGKKLYFSSNGHPGLGDADIFFSERLYGGWTVWSKPKNLGSEVNSNKFDAYFSIYDSAAYLSSNREGPLSDIYFSRIKLRNQTVLKDSINKIIADTKLLLTDIQSAKGTRLFTKFIALDLTVDGFSELKMREVLAFIEQSDRQRNGKYQLEFFMDSRDNQRYVNWSKNLVEYLIVNGISPVKISSNLSKGLAPKYGIEVRVVF
ncbi:MAG: hypothetical protein RH948_03080 [Cyclobacteriaceae bacterium]